MKYLTRRELAGYVATELIAKNTDIVEQLAAYLLESRRVREASLIVRDIESALAQRGVVVAHVASAHPLDESSKVSLEQLLKRAFTAGAVHLEESIEPKLLGGVKVTAADKELDSTARRTLNQLKAVKV